MLSPASGRFITRQYGLPPSPWVDLDGDDDDFDQRVVTAATSPPSADEEGDSSSESESGSNAEDCAEFSERVPLGLVNPPRMKVNRGQCTPVEFYAPPQLLMERDVNRPATPPLPSAEGGKLLGPAVHASAFEPASDDDENSSISAMVF